MATKTLTITEDAYDLLTGSKLESESFSEEIIRVMGARKSRKLIDFFGVLSENEGEEILKIIEKKRRENRKIIGKRKRGLVA